MFQRIIYLSYVFETKTIGLNVALKIKFAIITKKPLSKIMFRLITITKRNFLKENGMTLAKQSIIAQYVYYRIIQISLI